MERKKKKKKKKKETYAKKKKNHFRRENYACAQTQTHMTTYGGKCTYNYSYMYILKKTLLINVIYFTAYWLVTLNERKHSCIQETYMYLYVRGRLQGRIGSVSDFYIDNLF